jgi:hypothetical protein
MTYCSSILRPSKSIGFSASSLYRSRYPISLSWAYFTALMRSRATHRPLSLCFSFFLAFKFKLLRCSHWLFSSIMPTSHLASVSSLSVIRGQAGHGRARQGRAGRQGRQAGRQAQELGEAAIGALTRPQSSKHRPPSRRCMH